MNVDKLSNTQSVVALLIAVGTLLGLLGAGARFVFGPRLREMIGKVVDEKLDAREEANAATAEAEKTAIEDLGERIHRIEERMSENEKAAAQTQAAVERIEEATKRQTKTLEAIADGVLEIRDGFISQREKVARAEKDIEELQKSSRRRVR